jgi:hypothetical protein
VTRETVNIAAGEIGRYRIEIFLGYEEGNYLTKAQPSFSFASFILFCHRKPLSLLFITFYMGIP